MYLGRIHVRASLHQWVACYQQVENVFHTKNSMRYVRYGALKNRTVQRLPKHSVCRSNNTFIQPTDEIYY